MLTKYPQRSLLLAVEAVKAGQSLHGDRVAAAEQSLREALAASRLVLDPSSIPPLDLPASLPVAEAGGDQRYH